jgi:hypothetical protein
MTIRQEKFLTGIVADVSLTSAVIRPAPLAAFSAARRACIPRPSDSWTTRFLRTTRWIHAALPQLLCMISVTVTHISTSAIFRIPDLALEFHCVTCMAATDKEWAGQVSRCFPISVQSGRRYVPLQKGWLCRRLRCLAFEASGSHTIAMFA